MTVVDLTSAPQQPPGLREGLPRRLTLTLPELRLAASLAGAGPLPFEPTSRVDGHLDHRLGATDGNRAAYARALDTLPEAAESLRRRGLLDGTGLDGTGLDDTLAGALVLLTTPRLAVDLDVTVSGRQARSWHRQSGDLVASLATADGLVFELAWFLTGQWADELARVARLPAGLSLVESSVPDVVGLPYELADAAGEALRTQRRELLPELVARWPGQVVDAAGGRFDAAQTVALLTALTVETQGRLRVLAAAASRTPIAVASWALVGDGWRSVRPSRADGVDRVGVDRVGADRVELRRVDPADLGLELAPLLAGVLS